MKNLPLYKKCVNDAKYLFDTGNHYGMTIKQIADYLYNEAICKEERDAYHDMKLIEFNDEIVEIEELNERELMDIQVSGDNLFYANGLLTKNSIGLPQTADFMFAITTDEVLQDNDRQMFHLLKTRWGNKSTVKPQLVGIDFSKMRYYDVGSDPQQPTTDEIKNKVGKNKLQGKEKKLDDISWD